MDEKFTIPKVAVTEIIKEEIIFIDVRSPIEFHEFSYPNAINIAIFSDQERIQVGTQYKQKGKEEAIKIGLKFFSKKLPDLYQAFSKLAASNQNRKIVIACARGGMRSSSIVSTLNMLGVLCFQLEGGIRSYRQFITDELNKQFETPKTFFVLCGNTGTKKTEILQMLKHEGYPVIDFEGLAGHRGSVFGGIGLQSTSQKQFEQRLLVDLMQYRNFEYVIIESESRRIGNVVLPDYFINGKENGIRIEVELPLSNRVEHLLNTYTPNENEEKMLEAFRKIKKKIRGNVGTKIEQFMQNHQYELAFELLLTNYYDPLYNHTYREYSQINYKLSSIHLTEAISRLKDIIKEWDEKKFQYEGMAL